MLFAQSSDSVSLKRYYDIVNQYVDKHDDTYKELIDRIIKATARTARQKGKNLNRIDSSIFYIVNELYKSNAHFFIDHVDPEQEINSEVYLSLKSFLSTLSSSESDYLVL